MTGWATQLPAVAPAGLVVLLCALLAGLAASLSLSGPGAPLGGRGPGGSDPPVRDSVEAPGWMLRRRPWWCVLGGFGAWAFLGGPVGLVAAPVVAGACWVIIGRAEPAQVRRRREAIRRDLPAVVRLLGAALAAGAAPGEALDLVTDALPGAAADRLAPVASRLRLGADPVATWRELATEPALAPLGRTLARAQATGAPVLASVERLAEELARSARTEVEDRARAVGVRATVPLGLCLLPAFVLIGIVPVVGGLLSGLSF